MADLVSIIIPTKTIDAYVHECLTGIARLTGQRIEVILLPDTEDAMAEIWPFDLEIIATGPIKPSHKRNIGIRIARGDVMAFIDADARPFPDWLHNALRHLGKDDVGAVGGPNLTPPEDSLMQKASGDILASYVAWGPSAVRNRVNAKHVNGMAVREMPSCNLIVKTALIRKTCGFDAATLTGEDSKLCFDIRNLGQKVLYAPDVRVYHHRRRLYRPHLKQMYVYGRDKVWVIKGNFSKDAFFYFIPFGFILFLLSGLIVSVAYDRVAGIYWTLVAAYLLVAFTGSVIQSPKRCLLVFPGIVLTHMAYGIGSFWGLIRKGNV